MATKKQPIIEAATNDPPLTPQALKDFLVRVGTSQDKDAFVSLFHYFAPRIKSFMMKNGASDTIAEEIVQNTFITIWEKAHQYKPKKSAASTWIFTIARNKRIDLIRKEKFVDVNTDHKALTHAAYDKNENYVDTDEAEALNDAIETLPPEQEELIRMSFFDDKSHQTIADETNLPLGTVKSRLRLAMQKLRHILNGKGDAS